MSNGSPTRQAFRHTRRAGHGPLTLAQAFDPRSNSIGFLRWLLAFAVIFSHAGPLGGFYGGHDLGTQWSDEQSFGGVAVAGFFCLSGFLITKSRLGRATIFRYFWRRFLRIFPAFWAALLLTAFVLAPIAWWRVHDTLSGYWSATPESPLTYFSNNLFMRLNQRSIAELGDHLPLGQVGVRDWNGSAWTLIYEFKGYIIVGVMGLFGILVYRKLAAVAFGLLLLFNTMLWANVGTSSAYFVPVFRDYFNVMLLTPFVAGIMFALFADRIVIDDRLALAGASLAFITYFVTSGWNVYGQFGYLYVVMWCAVRLPLTRWEKYGDLSYGIYIYAWPLMQLLAFFGLHERGWLVYHVVVVVVVHVAAYASWHLLEKRALSLKNWTPRWLAAILERFQPWHQRAQRALIHPDFSSTSYAAARRHDEQELRREQELQDLVTHDVADRVAPRSP